MTADTLPAGAVEPIEGDELAVRSPAAMPDYEKATLAELLLKAIGADGFAVGPSSYDVAAGTLLAADADLDAILSVDADANALNVLEVCSAIGRVQERMRIGAELARRLREREGEDAAEDDS